ncbi:MAG: DUF1573 domain-containing protein [Pedobacter sp.]|nr:MAG: DUF1573 domain-containing protein [Pedobacter sp.]
MKKLWIIALVASSFAACTQSSSQTVEDKANEVNVAGAPALLAEDAPQMKFEKAIFDFGVIIMGEKVQYDFKFKNTGKTPLIITNAEATCGCTVPEYPKTPIKPGEEGTIRVIFDSQGKMGMQDKQVTLTTNANPAAEKLHLVGEIKEKK